MKHEGFPQGYDLCSVQECGSCEGTGWRKPGFCAANDMGGPLFTEKFYGIGHAPPPIPCSECIRGFRFAVVDLKKLLPYLLKQLQEDGKLRQELLDIVVTATENRVTSDKSDELA